MISTRHFLRGLGDNSMSMTIGMQEPKTLQEARDVAERYHHLREESSRTGARPLRSVSSSASFVTEERLVSFERRILSDIDEKISRITDSIKRHLQGNQLPRQKQGSRDRQPPRTIRCYECGVDGHIARNCPNVQRSQYTPPRNDRSTSAWDSNQA